MGSLITFGRVVSDARKRLEINQKQLADLVKRDGQSISPQYLNDIEHDRRTPSIEVIKQFGEALGLDIDYLHYLAKKWPEDLADGALGPEEVRTLFFAMRQATDRTDR